MWAPLVIGDNIFLEICYGRHPLRNIVSAASNICPTSLFCWDEGGNEFQLAADSHRALVTPYRDVAHGMPLLEMKLLLFA